LEKNKQGLIFHFGCLLSELYCLPLISEIKLNLKISWQYVVCSLCKCFQIVDFNLGSLYLHLLFGDYAEAVDVVGSWYLFQNLLGLHRPWQQQKPWTQGWCLEFTCRG